MKTQQKIAKYLILGVILISSLLFSCNKGIVEYIVREKYIYKNESNHDIKMLWYYRKSDSGAFLKDSLTLNNLENHLQEEEIFPPIGTYRDSIIINADSIRLTFDNNRTILYHRPTTSYENPYNILDGAIYNRTVVNDIPNYTYTFTEEDYNQAQ